MKSLKSLGLTKEAFLKEDHSNFGMKGGKSEKSGAKYFVGGKGPLRYPRGKK